MVKSKTIFSILFAIVFSVITIFAFVPLNNSQIFSKVDVTNELRTDTGSTLYNFLGSQVVIPYVERWRDDNNSYDPDANSSLMFALNFSYYNSLPLVGFYAGDYKCAVPYGIGNTSYWLWGDLYFTVENGSTLYEYFNPVNNIFYSFNNGSSYVINSDSFIKLVFVSIGGNYRFELKNVKLSYNTTTTPSYDTPYFDFTSITIGSTAWNGTSCSEYIQYNAKNGYFFRLDFYSFDIFASHFETRTYYTQSALSSDDYNLGYSQGVIAGYNTGFTDGNSNGYSDGYDVGYSQGETNGYNDGLLAGGNYTFMSLISATIDAPIQAFLGLFDFEVFGVDMKKFILGLILLSIVFIIIRLVIKGGR